MPLPADDTRWPPEDMAPAYAKMAEWAAWYSGEPDRIIDVYSPGPNRSGDAVAWWRFWTRARAHSETQRALLHVPVASDLAAVSGALLFGEPAKIRVRPDDQTVLDELAAQEEQAAAEKAAANPFVEGPAPSPKNASQPPQGDEGATADGPFGKTPIEPKAPQPGPPPTAPKPTLTAEQKTERRLQDIIEQGDLNARLVEAAESAAAIGGVYIYPVWDKDLRDVPLMAVAQADMAVPTFRWGILTAVTLWRPVYMDGNVTFRHLERHEVEGTGESRKCVVLHGLYKGTTHSLGKRVALSEREETARLEPRVEMPFPDLDVEYVPNIRPNRLWRASGLGVADVQGSESLLDGLDEVYASWMRDVRLAKARIIVPRDYLRFDPNDETNTTPAFDIDQEIYTTMDMDPGLTQDARAMMAHQFQIRYMEHRETAKDFVARIVSNAGYTPTTIGLEGSSGTPTGTALRVTEHKTILTLRRKSGWWRTALANVLYRMLLIDKQVFGSGIEPMRPTVLTADSIIDSPLELAQTVLALKTAESASIETRVRIVHPDWSTAEVQAEVARIEENLAAAKPPAPVTGGGTFGKPKSADEDTGEKPVTGAPDGKQDGPPPPPQVKGPA